MPVNEVVFPRSADGRRSSAALGRAVVVDALRVVDPVAADAAAREKDWRRGYLRHFRMLVEAGLKSKDAGYEIATAGLASVADRMRVSAEAGDDRAGDDQAEDDQVSLAQALRAGSRSPLGTVVVRGNGAPEREVSLPRKGPTLVGVKSKRQRSLVP